MIKARVDLTAKMVREMLSYDPSTGRFEWRIQKQGKGRKGEAAAKSGKNPYGRVMINYKPYLAHRLAWLYVYGEWPKFYIDHINGDPSDNRIVNLRQATPRQNVHNKRKGKAVGFKGVYQEKNRYRARINVRGKLLHLGCFGSSEEAHRAYCAAAQQYYGEFARG